MIIRIDSGHSASAASQARILLVDDEADILPEYQELLEMAGFACRTESDPEAALRIALDDPAICVVVTDLKMARLNGAELIGAIRAGVPSNRRMQFIILTGDATSQSLQAESNAPVLLKPIDFDELVDAVRTALDAAQ